MKKYFLNIAFFVLIAGIVSCDKDFNTIGSDIIGDNHFDFDKFDVPVEAYSVRTGHVQSNNLPVNHLGIYNDPAFGITKAHYVSQVTLAIENPIIGDSQVIDSVYFYVPYFSTLESAAVDGTLTYELDSIYGYNESAKFRLHVYENGYYIRDFDPTDNFESAQKYYTDDKATKIDPFKGSELLNNSSNVSQNEEFFIENKEILIYETDGNGLYVDANGDVLTDQMDSTLWIVKERKAPGIWLDLKKSYFQDKLFGPAAAGRLASNTLFKDYFKGLLFEVDEIVPGVGSMASLDFSRAEIRVLYTSTTTTIDAVGATVVTVKKNTLSLNIGHNGSAKKNNSINLIENTFSTGFIANADSAPGADLYVKGGNGSIVYIDIPMAGSTGLGQYVDAGYLLNEANLVFYINTVKMAANTIEPERIYLFDATNNTPIVDYTADTSVASDSKRSKSGLGGIIERETTSDKGVKYTIKLSTHINNLLNGDSDVNENIRLGLVVTENINVANNASLKTPYTVGTQQVSLLPFASVMSPLGTILYGTNPANIADFDKRLKLEIYYTKPDSN
uniref:DUF4270 domain-containing protein n=1 Tax=Flavobacterium sp. TaxID=239 RepID=UPI00404B56B8